MPAAISAADANREFSKLLGRVRAGQSFVIISHGKPVARLVPISAEDRVRAAVRRCSSVCVRRKASTFLVPGRATICTT